MTSRTSPRPHVLGDFLGPCAQAALPSQPSQEASYQQRFVGPRRSANGPRGRTRVIQKTVAGSPALATVTAKSSYHQCPVFQPGYSVRVISCLVPLPHLSYALPDRPSLIRPSASGYLSLTFFLNFLGPTTFAPSSAPTRSMARMTMHRHVRTSHCRIHTGLANLGNGPLVNGPSSYSLIALIRCSIF